MAIIQNKEFKNQLLIVDKSQVGIRDRGVEPYTQNNAIIEGNVVDFHPMVRENWGTTDPPRDRDWETIKSWFLNSLFCIIAMS